MKTFNRFVDKHRNTLKNIKLCTELFTGLVISVVTIYISTVANDISKTANGISNQSLELQKKELPPKFSFENTQRDGKQVYKINKSGGEIDTVYCRLKIRISIFNVTKNISVENILSTGNLDNSNHYRWELIGENSELDLKKYCGDIKWFVENKMEGDKIIVDCTKLLVISYRDYGNNFHTEYYKEDKNGDFKYDDYLTQKEISGNWNVNNCKGSTNSFIETLNIKNVKNENQKYKENLQKVVNFIVGSMKGEFNFRQ